jgi:hypothetical protein
MSAISQLNSSPVTLERTLGVPAEGPKCVPLTLDFSSIQTLELDYGNMQSRGFLAMCQTLWVDNFNSATILTILIPGTGQTLKIPAGVQGYFTCLCPSPIHMIFSSTGGVVCQVTLCNFPVWS